MDAHREHSYKGQVDALAWAQEILLRLLAVELRTREVANRTSRSIPPEHGLIETLNSLKPQVPGTKQMEQLLELLCMK